MSVLDPSVRTEHCPCSTKACAPTVVRARPRRAHRRMSVLDQGVRTDRGPLQELDQGVRTDRDPLQELDRGVRPTKVCAPKNVRARPRRAHRPRSPSGARPRRAHRPRSELDRGVRPAKVCAPNKSVLDQGVRTEQCPSSTKACAPNNVRARPRRAHRTMSVLDQGVRTEQVPARSRRAHRPRSELDQGVRIDPGPSSRSDQGVRPTKVCAPNKVIARPRRAH